jgi:hypothetical protein
MIRRIAIIAAAHHAICSTLPEEAPLWPVLRQDGLIHVEAAVLDRLRTMRRPGTFLLSRTSRPFTGSLEEPLSVQRGRRADFVDLLGPSPSRNWDSLPAVATKEARGVLIV